MKTSSRFGAWIVVLAVALGGGGCGEEPAEPTPDPAVVEEQQRQAAEAQRRQQEAAALAERASALTGEVAGLAGGAQDLPVPLQEAVQTADAKADQVEGLVAELEGQSGEAWAATKGRLEAALGELESARGAAASAVAGWREKEAEAREARSQGGVIDEATGLLKGLDGGEYDHYLVSFVERVQRRLRQEGLYAGPVDGVFGAGTRKAIGAYQEQQGLYVSGVPSPMTRARLFADAG